jgi:hypothetical protein
MMPSPRKPRPRQNSYSVTRPPAGSVQQRGEPKVSSAVAQHPWNLGGGPGGRPATSPVRALSRGGAARTTAPEVLPGRPVKPGLTAWWRRRRSAGGPWCC